MTPSALMSMLVRSTLTRLTLTPPAASTVVPTGIRLDEFVGGDPAGFRRMHGIRAEQPLVLTVSRLAIEKNIDFLLEVAAKVEREFDDFVFVIAGEGPDATRLGKLAASLGLDERVRFLGNLDRNLPWIKTNAVYALTRNPLYFGSSLLAAGFAVMSANETAAALLILPFGVIYPTVMLREEAHLSRLFPDEYRLYKSKVPRFFPRPTLRFPRSFSFSQYLSNREYNTALGFAGALAVFCIKSWLA